MKYPVEYGYKVEVEIIRDEETDSATIKVHAPFYVKKEWILSHSYKSSDFTDSQILRDHSFRSVMINHYGTE